MTMHPSDIALNDYVDGALQADAKAEVERHLESCAECRATVAGLRDVKKAVADLRPLEPPAGAWPRIRAGVESNAAKRHDGSPRRALTWLAAAAAVLIAVGGAWYAVPKRPVAPPATSSSAPAGGADAQAVESELRQAEEHYQKAISGLEQIANSEKGALDPQTAATLQKNLSVIDTAIGESREAIKQQPTSEPAQQSLLENFKTKLGLLEDTVALINEMRKGNEAGTARIASGLKQKG